MKDTRKLKIQRIWRNFHVDCLPVQPDEDDGEEGGEAGGDGELEIIGQEI